MFPITRMYSDNNCDSHFEDIEVELKEASSIGKLSSELSAKGIVFQEVEPSYDYDFHTAPQKQYILLLDGEIEIATSLGEKESLEQGRCCWSKTRQAKGHKTRNNQPIKRKSIFITLP